MFFELFVHGGTMNLLRVKEGTSDSHEIWLQRHICDKKSFTRAKLVLGLTWTTKTNSPFILEPSGPLLL